MPAHPSAPPASLRFLRLCVADIRELQPSVLMSEEVYVRMCARENSLSLSLLLPSLSIYLSFLLAFSSLFNALHVSLSFLLSGSASSAHCIFARVYTFINRLTYRATTTTTGTTTIAITTTTAIATTASPREPAPD